MKYVRFFPNGNTVCFENDEQDTVLQRSWLQLYVDFLLSKDVDPTAMEFTMPDGKVAKVFKTDEGYNWKFQDKEV